jgi:hypothetical protein
MEIMQFVEQEVVVEALDISLLLHLHQLSMEMVEMAVQELFFYAITGRINITFDMEFLL